MAEKNEIYKCSLCGSIVEILHSGGAIQCCNQEMELLKEKTADEGNEKHVPVIERDGNNIKVNVGSVPHPMEESHYIEWIELIADGISYRKFLVSGGKPEAVFCIDAENMEARAYCNLHGLWKSV